AAISASASHAHTPLATHARATPTTSTCDAAIPLMPSMKFQMLDSTSTASTATTDSHGRSNVSCIAVPNTSPASAWTSNRSHGESGRWSSTSPATATIVIPTTNAARSTRCWGSRNASAQAATSRASTSAMPPPRGVATAWLRRSPGWSIRSRPMAYRRAAHVAIAAMAACRINQPIIRSDHRVVEERLDRPPLLAARALPMVAARTEAAACAPVTGIAHQQLVGDVLEVDQGRGRVRAVGKAEIDQCRLAAHRGAVLELFGQVGARGRHAFASLDHAGQGRLRGDAALVLAHLGQERACPRDIPYPVVTGQQRRHHFRQVIRVVARDPLERSDSGLVVARIHLDASLQHPRAHGVGV